MVSRGITKVIYSIEQRMPNSSLYYEILKIGVINKKVINRSISFLKLSPRGTANLSSGAIIYNSFLFLIINKLLGI